MHNVAPTVNAGADTTGHEGSIVSRAVFVSDPGPRDTHTASVDWDDGTSTSIPSAEAPSFEIEHVYADNDVYTVEVCVTDDDDAEDCHAFSVTVANAAPGTSITTLGEGPSFFLPGVSIPLAGGLTDAGTLDSTPCRSRGRRNVEFVDERPR